MNLHTIRNFLQTILPVGDLWFGLCKMDTGLRSCLCLYDAPTRGERYAAIGGYDCTGYRQKRLMLLLRYGTDALAAAKFANEIHGALAQERIVLDGRNGFMRPSDDGPAPLGTDPHGVWEYRIDFEIFYEM